MIQFTFELNNHLKAIKKLFENSVVSSLDEFFIESGGFDVLFV